MNEKFARILTAIFLLGGSLAIGFAWWLGQRDVITLHALMPEAGGWTPADLTVAAGQPLHLRLISEDVMHGFAIGQSDQPAVDVKPGEMNDYTVISIRFPFCLRAAPPAATIPGVGTAAHLPGIAGRRLFGSADRFLQPQPVAHLHNGFRQVVASLFENTVVAAAGHGRFKTGGVGIK